jgi:predicted GNAT family acetyltransferase
MQSLVSYPTAQQFLDATGYILEQREMENNLILGLCNAFEDKTKVYNDCVFINAFADNQLQASSIKTAAKAIISSITKNTDALKALADYYLQNRINLGGAVGESYSAHFFSEYYGRPEINERGLIVHQLTTVNNVSKTTGKLEAAGMEDVELLTDWTVRFEEDAKTFPRYSREVLRGSTQRRISKSDIYKWVVNGKNVSFAAIVRKTRNAGIVGLVYTPNDQRGKGYATSCVQKLSEHILQSGFKYCGLFTDKANPESNYIYKKIGYLPITEFSDIEFGTNNS